MLPIRKKLEITADMDKAERNRVRNLRYKTRISIRKSLAAKGIPSKDLTDEDLNRRVIALNLQFNYLL